MDPAANSTFEGWWQFIIRTAYGRGKGRAVFLAPPAKQKTRGRSEQDCVSQSGGAEELVAGFGFRRIWLRFVAPVKINSASCTLSGSCFEGSVR